MMRTLTIEEELERRRKFFANPPERHVCGFCGKKHHRGTFTQYDHDETVKATEESEGMTTPPAADGS